MGGNENGKGRLVSVEPLRNAFRKDHSGIGVLHDLRRDHEMWQTQDDIAAQVQFFQPLLDHPAAGRIRACVDVDLGGGLAALLVLENGFDLNSGSLGQTNRGSTQGLVFGHPAQVLTGLL